MGQNEHNITPVQTLIPTVTQEFPRSTPKVTWKVIVICVLISLGSALISAYLTLERVSSRSLSELSEAAEMAYTLREEWRQLYKQSVEEREALKTRVKELDAQIAKLTGDIKEHRKHLDLVQAKTPTYAEVKKSVESASKTDAGLRKEARNILGDLGVKNIRIIDSKTGQ